MPTVIDSLLIELGLDSSKFTKGQKESTNALKRMEQEAARTAKEMEARGKQAASYFGSIKTQVVGLLAAFTAGAGLKSFVTSIVGSDAAMGRMAKNVGMTTDEVSAWQAVAERAGGSAGGMAGSIQNLSRGMQELALTGQSSAIPFLTAAHVNLQKFFDATTPMSEKLLELSDAFQGMDPAKAQALGAGMGLDEGTINVLMQGRGAVMALLAEQQKIGHTNAEDAAAAMRLQSAWRALGQASEDLGRKILTNAAPVIERMSNALLRLSEWAATHRPLVEAMFWGLAVTAAAFAAALTAPVAGIAALSAGIGIAVAAIAVLYDDWRTWIDGGESAFGEFWQFFADKWQEAGPAVMNVLASIGAGFSDFIAVVKAGLHLIYALFFGTSGDIRAAWEELFAGFGHLISDFVDTIAHLGPVILNAFKSAFTGALGWVEGRLSKIWSAITGKNVEPVTPDDRAPGVAGAAGAPEGGSWFSRMAQHLGVGGGEAPAASANGTSARGPSDSVAHSLFGNLIARGEGDYDSVNRGAAGGYAAGKEDLESMTVAQVQAAQKAQKFNAAGRYQIIGPTLDAAVKSMGLKGDEKFDRGMQDKIFSQYLAGTKRPEIGNYINGKSNDVGAAILAASKEWASVADPTTGQSHYAGSGNNKASISAAEMTQALNEARAMASAGAGVQVAKNTNNQTATTNTHSNEVNIASVTVNTQATDANGVAKGLHQAVRNQFATASQANYGLG